MAELYCLNVDGHLLTSIDCIKKFEAGEFSRPVTGDVAGAWVTPSLQNAIRAKDDIISFFGCTVELMRLEPALLVERKIKRT